MHSGINENINLLVLLHNEQNYGSDIKVYDLSKNVLSIDLKIDNKLIILNGEIVGTRLKNENSNNLNKDDYPEALLQYLLGLHNKDNVDMNIIKKSLKSSAGDINNQTMLTKMPNGFSYNSPYYNNSFEYAMNSLSNPIVNNLESNNPSEFAQMLLDKDNVKDLSHLCNSKKSQCGCCGTREKIPNKKEKEKEKIEKNIEKTNNKNLKTKINETSKIGRKFSSLDSNMTMFNTTADLNDKTKKNFTPDLAKHSSDGNIPRPILADFSNF